MLPRFLGVSVTEKTSILAEICVQCLVSDYSHMIRDSRKCEYVNKLLELVTSLFEGGNFFQHPDFCDLNESLQNPRVCLAHDVESILKTTMRNFYKNAGRSSGS